MCTLRRERPLVLAATTALVLVAAAVAAYMKFHFTQAVCGIREKYSLERAQGMGGESQTLTYASTALDSKSEKLPKRKSKKCSMRAGSSAAVTQFSETRRKRNNAGHEVAVRLLSLCASMCVSLTAGVTGSYWLLVSDFFRTTRQFFNWKSFTFYFYTLHKITYTSYQTQDLLLTIEFKVPISSSCFEIESQQREHRE
jgi:hypothetical protein